MTFLKEINFILKKLKNARIEQLNFHASNDQVSIYAKNIKPKDPLLLGLEIHIEIYSFRKNEKPLKVFITLIEEDINEALLKEVVYILFDWAEEAIINYFFKGNRKK